MDLEVVPRRRLLPAPDVFEQLIGRNRVALCERKIDEQRARARTADIDGTAVVVEYLEWTQNAELHAVHRRSATCKGLLSPLPDDVVVVDKGTPNAQHLAALAWEAYTRGRVADAAVLAHACVGCPVRWFPEGSAGHRGRVPRGRGADDACIRAREGTSCRVPRRRACPQREERGQMSNLRICDGGVRRPTVRCERAERGARAPDLIGGRAAVVGRLLVERHGAAHHGARQAGLRCHRQQAVVGPARAGGVRAGRVCGRRSASAPETSRGS